MSCSRPNHCCFITQFKLESITAQDLKNKYSFYAHPYCVLNTSFYITNECKLGTHREDKKTEEGRGWGERGVALEGKENFAERDQFLQGPQRPTVDKDLK